MLLFGRYHFKIIPYVMNFFYVIFFLSFVRPCVEVHTFIHHCEEWGGVKSRGTPHTSDAHLIFVACILQQVIDRVTKSFICWWFEFWTRSNR